MRSTEEQRKFLLDMINVQLDFIYFKRNREPHLEMKSLIERYCMIPNFTEFHDGGIFDVTNIIQVDEWNMIVDLLDDVWDYTNTREEWISSSMGLLANTVERRINVDVDRFNWAYENLNIQNTGSLRYNPFGEICDFHIFNAFYPASFMDEENHFENDVTKLIETCKANNVQEIRCGSWLNQYPKFLSYFPEEYAVDPIVVTDIIDGQLGIWGQFITHNCTVNKHTWDKLIEKQDIPFYMTTCTLKI